MRPQIQQHIAGPIKPFLRRQQLPLHRERVGDVQIAQGKQAKQVLPQADGNAQDAGTGIAHQGDALGPGRDDYPVILPQILPEIGVMVGPLGIAQDGGQAGDGLAQLGVNLQGAVGAAIHGGMHPAGNHLRHGPFQDYLLPGFPVHSGAHFIIGAAAQQPGQLVAVQVDGFHIG